ncbi:hypothetical protein KN1_27930 [Stygiolobus caldivivus]|uniref:Uncharacterized protein n=1 Tax=Stygiolobus caldivivus TaxID=2824673 RepID=A0A8D5UA40_9CREN|nr:hypothetical protein KN1_27930 [Stygiolobus caldivivus]
MHGIKLDKKTRINEVKDVRGISIKDVVKEKRPRIHCLQIVEKGRNLRAKLGEGLPNRSVKKNLYRSGKRPEGLRPKLRPPDPKPVTTYSKTG